MLVTTGSLVCGVHHICSTLGHFYNTRNKNYRLIKK
uniref:Uncharacterized protein n=1 Tax=Anguilla anguilla TaxID=7936 RepID=A0A0E9TAK6_ANGAN